MEKTDPSWDNGGANVLIVAIIAVVADLIVRRAAPVRMKQHFFELCESILNLSISLH